MYCRSALGTTKPTGRRKVGRPRKRRKDISAGTVLRNLDDDDGDDSNCTMPKFLTSVAKKTKNYVCYG
jgi:hypothetical protein